MNLIKLLTVLLLLPSPAFCDWSREKERIEFLLMETGKVEGVFIRNGQAYNPENAVSHLKMKLQKAMNSWFAPDQKHWTAELFIDQLATKSSLSGRLYQIRFNDGKTVPAGDWLHQKLAHAPKSR